MDNSDYTALIVGTDALPSEDALNNYIIPNIPQHCSNIIIGIRFGRLKLSESASSTLHSIPEDINLMPDQTKTVTFPVGQSQLKMLDVNLLGKAT